MEFFFLFLASFFLIARSEPLIGVDGRVFLIIFFYFVLIFFFGSIDRLFGFEYSKRETDRKRTGSFVVDSFLFVFFVDGCCCCCFILFF